jgi:molybdopterin/thiamine biosynthesis adenylyltransferase
MTKHVTVVGVGALGSHLVQFLRSEDVKIKVIDFDRVEQKNVQSQFHGKPNVGKLKVLSLNQSMQFLYGIKIECVSGKLVENNADVLLSKADLIIDCLDNGEARRLIQGYARTNDTPCLHGALAPNGGFGRAIWDEQFVIDSEAGQGGATCENGEFLPFIAITSAYMARAAQIFLATGKKTGFSISPNSVVAV